MLSRLPPKSRPRTGSSNSALPNMQQPIQVTRAPTEPSLARKGGLHRTDSRSAQASSSQTTISHASRLAASANASSSLASQPTSSYASQLAADAATCLKIAVAEFQSAKTGSSLPLSRSSLDSRAQPLPTGTLASSSSSSSSTQMQRHPIGALASTSSSSSSAHMQPHPIGALASTSSSSSSAHMQPHPIGALASASSSSADPMQSHPSEAVTSTSSSSSRGAASLLRTSSAVLAPGARSVRSRHAGPTSSPVHDVRGAPAISPCSPGSLLGSPFLRRSPRLLPESGRDDPQSPPDGYNRRGKAHGPYQESPLFVPPFPRAAPSSDIQVRTTSIHFSRLLGSFEHARQI
jgi:hypothetical protein